MSGNLKIRRLKQVFSDTLFRCGFDVRRASQFPFGVRWERDISFFSNGKSLEIAFDVGANTGQTALNLVRYFPKSQVYSFEPVGSTFNVLVENTSKFANIIPIRCALGRERGSAKMTADSLSQTNTLKFCRNASNRTALIEVNIETVDSFCDKKKIPRISLLKIDTEGAELDVLRGAQNLMNQNKIDYILVECDFFRREAQPHGDFVEISSFISNYGFHVVSFYTGGVDDLGWVWGDVLFRNARTSNTSRLACSPCV